MSEFGKQVNIVLDTAPADSCNSDDDTSSLHSSANIERRPRCSTPIKRSNVTMPNTGRNLPNEEILFTSPTISERIVRYLVIIIYLGGLSSLGFCLSIYYIFFWDSRMPPVYKPAKKPPVFIKP